MNAPLSASWKICKIVVQIEIETKRTESRDEAYLYYSR